MLTDMHEFHHCVVSLVTLLRDNEKVDLANDLENALFISQSSLEILGEVKKITQQIKKNGLINEKKINEKIILINNFIDKYW